MTVNGDFLKYFYGIKKPDKQISYRVKNEIEKVLQFFYISVVRTNFFTVPLNKVSF